MKGPEDDEDDGVSQRTVHATDSSPLFTPAASSVFNWRGAGAAPAPAPVDTGTHEEAPTPKPQPKAEEKTTMATRTRKSTPRTGSGSPQVQICSVLLQKGDLNAEALAAALPQFDMKQVKYAINNAMNNDRVTSKGDTYHLTAAGKAWVQASMPEEAEPEKPARAAAGRNSAKKQRRTRAAKAEVDTPPAEEEEPAFRCGVMSDGCFFITKEGVSIDLDASEHAQMLHYLERMAVAA